MAINKLSTLLLLFFLATNLSFAQLKKGDAAPEIIITNWIKNVPESKDLNGKFVIIDFGATWCAPCLESVPHMDSLVNKFKNTRNLVFLALTDEKVAKVNYFMKRVPFASAVVTDTTGRTMDDFKVSSIPYCVVIDEKKQIKWAGNPADLTHETISKVMEGKDVTPVVKTESSTPEATRTMYRALHKTYVKAFDDNNLKNYFSMEPLNSHGMGAMWSRGGGKNSHREAAIGVGIIGGISDLLDVADIQVLIPDNLSKSYISYCYKSEVKNTRKDVLDSVLHHLDLRYTVADSLMDVIQLEVANKDLFNKFVFDTVVGRVGHASSSNTYAAVDQVNFSGLKSAIEGRFKQIVVFKNESNFNKKVSMTIKIDTMENLITTLGEYGVKVSTVKKKLPVYRFAQMN